MMEAVKTVAAGLAQIAFMTIIIIGIISGNDDGGEAYTVPNPAYSSER